jgi:uncharacterized protein YkwD
MICNDTASLCLVEARPRTLVKRLALVIAVAIAALSVVPVASARGSRCHDAHMPIAAASRPGLQRSVVCLINQQRRSHGLPGLSESSRLNRSAQGWTDVMVSHRYFSHGADFASRISAVGFNWSSVGENIATGYLTPSSVVDAWMGSAGHCQNILNPTYRYVGTGVSNSSVSGYGTRAGTRTQDFGLLMGQPAASGNWGPANGCPYR